MIGTCAAFCVPMSEPALKGSKIVCFSNKALNFDTRVSELTSIFALGGADVTHIDIFCPHGSRFRKIVYANIELLKLVFKNRASKEPARLIAYLPDMISVYKAAAYIFLGGRFLLDVHDYEHDRAPMGIERLSWKYQITLWLQKIAMRRSDAVMTVSKLMSRFLSRWSGTPIEKFHCLYNSFDDGSSSCGCGNAGQYDAAAYDFSIGLVGMKSEARGSADLVEAIKRGVASVCFPTKVARILVRWHGSASVRTVAEKIEGKNFELVFEDTPLLCQKCLLSSVGECSAGIHAYKPEFANARHAVPNKLFTFVSSKPSKLFFSGDVECKGILKKHFDGRALTWRSSKMGWESTLIEVEVCVKNWLENNATAEVSKKTTVTYPAAAFKDVNKKELERIEGRLL